MEKSRFVFIFFCITIISLVDPTKCYDHIDHPTSLFIFGDSLFDSGNNNYINTTARANFYPYGETFFKHPTGRFSDGRLIPDFFAEYAKLPFILPYLQPGNHEYSYGVNFGSAGAGALVETYRGYVIDLKTQLGYFKNVNRVLRKKLGDKKAEALISKAVYSFSIGNNDYSVAAYEQTNSTVLPYSDQQLVGLVIGNITEVIQEIYEIGGRKFGFQTVGHLGCAPYARAFEGTKAGACNEKILPFVQLHNSELLKLLKKLQIELQEFKYSLLDFYSFFLEIIDNPSKFGFKEAKVACCGSGPYRGTSSCGWEEYELCDNVSDYVFFDSGHPTEKANQQFAKLAWSGKLSVTGSYNFKALFAA
ncbi:GDSL esterase/lipase 1 [Morus notabilis]|uniref:GDSL esterase/lipase 1 n=1 Tax=Morus notabilis TaxID=981085 RepID=UPI000CECF55D|nr:GDSL esterase/lipase 1 [Morus notabilis]